LDAAAEAIEEREQEIVEIEEAMEKEYGYLTTRQEIETIREAVRVFMTENHLSHVFRDSYKLTLVRRGNGKWNESKTAEARAQGCLAEDHEAGCRS
jgi:hypothetical protein